MFTRRLTASERIEYEKKKDFVIENVKALGLEQKKMVVQINEQGYKIDRPALSKMLNGKLKLTLRWLPILDIIIELIKEEQEKVEQAKKIKI